MIESRARKMYARLITRGGWRQGIVLAVTALIVAGLPVLAWFGLPHAVDLRDGPAYLSATSVLAVQVGAAVGTLGFLLLPKGIADTVPVVAVLAAFAYLGFVAGMEGTGEAFTDVKRTLVIAAVGIITLATLEWYLARRTQRSLDRAAATELAIAALEADTALIPATDQMTATLTAVPEQRGRIDTA